MHYRLLFRPPLVYVTIAECILVGAILALSWHLWNGRQPSTASPSQAAVSRHAGRPATATSSQPSRLPAPAGPSATPSSPPPPAAGAPQAGPTPGTRTDSAFVSRQMSELNRVEATFEDLEWRMTKALADGIQSYVERVVLPSIDRSEHGGHA